MFCSDFGLNVLGILMGVWKEKSEKLNKEKAKAKSKQILACRCWKSEAEDFSWLWTRLNLRQAKIKEIRELQI